MTFLNYGPYLQCGNEYLPIDNSSAPLGRQVTIEVEVGEDLHCIFHNEQATSEQDYTESEKVYLPIVVK